jgi:hypothetical protein
MTTPPEKLTAVDAAHWVLKESGRPMHISEIARRISELGIWETHGLTPARTIGARIGDEINKRGDDSRFRRAGPGIFGLR